MRPKDPLKRGWCVAGRSRGRRHRSAWRLVAVGALLALAGVSAGTSSGAPRLATPTDGSTFATGRISPTVAPPAIGRAQAAATPPLGTNFFAGYAAFATFSTTTSATFTVPRRSCGGTTTAGTGPGVFVNAGDAGQTLDAAGVLDQCIDGVVTITPAVVVSSDETNLTNPVQAGDTMESDVTVGPGGTTVTLKDLTPARAFTQTLSGSDNIPADELIGEESTSHLGVSIPVGEVAPASFTNSTVNGAAIGSETPSRVLLVHGCNVTLRPGAIDGVTQERFTVAAPLVHITGLQPASAPTGTRIEIDGSGFNAAAKVHFGSADATAVSHDSATTLHATVPKTAVTAQISVDNIQAPGVGTTSACAFRVLPTITSFSPHAGVTGSSMAINGSGLTPGTQVLFGGLPGRVLFRSPTLLKVLAANGASRNPVTVETAAGSAVSADDFTPTLSLTSFSPQSGPPGTSVSISGVGFTRSSTVRFNGVPAPAVTHVSSTELTAVAPLAVSGPISVTNTTAPIGTAKSVKPFIHL